MAAAEIMIAATDTPNVTISGQEKLSFCGVFGVACGDREGSGVGV